MTAFSHRPPSSVQLVSLIHVSALRGADTDEDPTRFVEQYFSTDGRLLACFDPLNGPPDHFYTLAERMKPEDARLLFGALRTLLNAAETGDPETLTRACVAAHALLASLPPDEMR